MARIARVVAPGIPHHITQRGDRRQASWRRRIYHNAGRTYRENSQEAETRTEEESGLVPHLSMCLPFENSNKETVFW